jgi:hypothetical protein
MLSTLQVTPFTDAVNCCVCVEVAREVIAGDTVIAALAGAEVEIRIVLRKKTREVTPELLFILLPPEAVFRTTRIYCGAGKCTLFRCWLD